jgi:hypothetical protein
MLFVSVWLLQKPACSSEFPEVVTVGKLEQAILTGAALELLRCALGGDVTFAALRLPRCTKDTSSWMLLRGLIVSLAPPVAPM